MCESDLMLILLKLISVNAFSFIESRKIIDCECPNVKSGEMTLSNLKASQDLGFDEFMEDDGVTVIEWAAFVPELIPEEYLNICISLLEDEKRCFEMTAKGARYEQILEGLS